MNRHVRPLSPPLYLLKFPVDGLPRPENFLLCFPSVPGKEPPSMFPNRVPMERKASSPEPMVYSLTHLYLSESPISSPPTKMGKTYGHHPHSPMWTEGLHTMGCSLVPQGDHLRHCNLYPSAMQPSARYLPPWLG